MQALVRSASTDPDNQSADVSRTAAGPRKLFAAVLAIVLLTALPVAANAKSSPGGGVHIDPGSPAGKEYAIPLGSARGNGTNGTSTLFGAGITKSPPSSGSSASDNSATPATSSTASSTSGGTSTSTAPKRHVQRHHRRQRGGTGAHAPAKAIAVRQVVPAAQSPQRLIGTSAGSSDGVTWMLGVAVLVLLLGGAGSVLLTRRGRRATPSPS